MPPIQNRILMFRTGTQAFRNYTERDPAANAEKYSKKIYDQYKQQQ